MSDKYVKATDEAIESRTKELEGFKEDFKAPGTAEGIEDPDKENGNYGKPHDDLATRIDRVAALVPPNIGKEDLAANIVDRMASVIEDGVTLKPKIHLEVKNMDKEKITGPESFDKAVESRLAANEKAAPAPKVEPKAETVTPPVVDEKPKA